MKLSRGAENFKARRWARGRVTVCQFVSVEEVLGEEIEKAPRGSLRFKFGVQNRAHLGVLGSRLLLVATRGFCMRWTDAKNW